MTSDSLTATAAFENLQREHAELCKPVQADDAACLLARMLTQWSNVLAARVEDGQIDAATATNRRVVAKYALTESFKQARSMTPDERCRYYAAIDLADLLAGAFLFQRGNQKRLEILSTLARRSVEMVAAGVGSNAEAEQDWNGLMDAQVDEGQMSPATAAKMKAHVARVLRTLGQPKRALSRVRASHQAATTPRRWQGYARRAVGAGAGHDDGGGGGDGDGPPRARCFVNDTGLSSAARHDRILAAQIRRRILTNRAHVTRLGDVPYAWELADEVTALERESYRLEIFQEIVQ
jgi:hypothetical protein